MVKFRISLDLFNYDNILWEHYMKDNNLKTDYVPVISVSDAAIISLT
jgi:hypothetical protein